MFPSSVQITEVLWTLGGIPGWLIWFFNGRYAHSVFKAAVKHGDKADRVWAGMTLFLTLAALSVESSSIGLGIFGMTQNPVRAHVTLLGWAVTIHILLVSFAVLVVGIAWAYSVETLREGVKRDVGKVE